MMPRGASRARPSNAADAALRSGDGGATSRQPPPRTRVGDGEGCGSAEADEGLPPPSRVPYSSSSLPSEPLLVS